MARADTLITYCQTLIGDPEGDYHNREKVLLHLNTALEDIATRSRTLCDWVYIPVQEGRGIYGLPENFLEFKFIGYDYRGELLPLSPGSVTDTAPLIFRDRPPKGLVPHTYSIAGNSFIEKLVGTIVETTAAETAIYTSADVPIDATDDDTLDVVNTTGAYLGEIDTPETSVPLSTPGTYFIRGTQGFLLVEGGLSRPDASFTTETGVLEGTFIASNTVAGLITYFAQTANAYDTTKVYYYYDTELMKLRLVKRAARTTRVYVGNPETDFAVNITPREFSSIVIGDKIVNRTDGSEGRVTDTVWYDADTAIIYFNNLFNGDDNQMQIGDEFRVLSFTAHRHAIAIAPPAEKDDEVGEESLYIFMARNHKPFSIDDLDNANDEIELGEEFNSTLRFRVLYYMSHGRERNRPPFNHWL